MPLGNIAGKGLLKGIVKKRLSKITMGAVGATGALLGSPEDAEAGFLTKAMFKHATKSGLGKVVKKGIESSASKDLKGYPYRNSTIKKVWKGSKDWRYVELNDGTTELVDKKIINSLARERGTAEYMNRFDSGGKQSRLVQAYRSLELHLKNANKNKEIVLDFYKSYRTQLHLNDKRVPELVLAEQNKNFFTFPKQYAELLEKEKKLKIVEVLKDKTP